MVVRNNKLLITRYDGLVAAIDLNSAVRNVSWQEQFPGLTTSAFRGNRLYVGGLNGDVHALDADTGRRVFRAVTGAAVTSITAGETALFVAGHKGRISALDAANGNLLWHDAVGGALASPPVLFEDGIYFASGAKTLYGYKLR
jgi:outer membrane protein assembly factor BamB